MTEFHALRTSAIAHADFRAQIVALTDDEETIRDTLEGASSFPEFAIAAARHIKEREAYAAGLRDYMGQLKARMERMDAGTDKMREILAIAILESGEKTIKDAAVTISARIGPSKVHVVNELELPADFMRQKITYTPDKDAIREALDSGQAVPGAQLTNGQPTLTLRVK